MRRTDAFLHSIGKIAADSGDKPAGLQACRRAILQEVTEMKMIINGKKVDSESGLTFDIINPATGEVIEAVPKATEKDVIAAIDAAEKGQKVWAEMPVWQRAQVLYKFLDIVDANKEALAQTLCAENGKPIVEARAEIGNIRIGFSGFIEAAKHYYGSIIPQGQEQGQDKNMQLITREPIGIVACIIPFNFPCDLYDQKVAPALMMGNAAIVLPSSDNPLTLMKLTEMLVEAGVPNGAIQCLTAPGSVKAAAVKDPRVHLVTLTGSTEVGIDTAKLAAANLTHTALELGGNDAFIVLDDGDVDLAVEELIWGRMYNTGQVCCASKRFLIHNSLKDEFAKKAVERISRLKVGMPADVAIDMEIFGPVVPIIGFDTDEEAIEIANKSIFGLSSCVFSRDQKRAFKVASKMEAGGAVINGASFFRAFEQPFGGWKHSGIGTEGVFSTFDEMTLSKTIVLKNIF